MDEGILGHLRELYEAARDSLLHLFEKERLPDCIDQLIPRDFSCF